MNAVPESAGLAMAKPFLKRASSRSCHDFGGTRHLLGVIGNAQRSQPRRREKAVGILDRALHELGLGGDVLHEHAFTLELVEVGNLAVPEDVDRHLAGLPLGGDLGHQFAGAGRVIVEGDLRMLGLKRVAQLADEAFLHRGVDHQLFAGAGILACTEGQADGGGQKQEVFVSCSSPFV